MNKKKLYYNLNGGKSLNQYDLIHKYGIKNYFNIPRIESLELSVSSKNLSNSLNKNQNLLNRFFFVTFFLFSSEKGFIQSKDPIKSRNNFLKEDEDFLIKNKISKKNLLQDLLRILFNDNSFVLFLQKNFNHFHFDLKKEKMKISFEIPFFILHDYSYLINSFPLKMNSKDGTVFISFLLKNVTKKLFFARDIKIFFKNFSFFWLT